MVGSRPWAACALDLEHQQTLSARPPPANFGPAVFFCPVSSYSSASAWCNIRAPHRVISKNLGERIALLWWWLVPHIENARVQRLVNGHQQPHG